MFTDVHSHILPTIDHGTSSIGDSLAQARNAIAAGIGTVIATPHFYLKNDTVDDFLVRRAASYQLLTQSLRDHRLDLRIIPAAEVTLYVDLLQQDLRKLCVGSTRYILIELPDRYWTDWVYDAVYKISAQHRLIPVIAHIDRYSAAQVERLLAMDPPAQVNAEAFGSFSLRKRMLTYIEDGKIRFLGSDAHHTGEKQYKNYKKAVRYIQKHNTRFMEHAGAMVNDKG